MAGGTITPVPTPGSGYVNDVNHPYPFMIFLPKGYSSSASYPLVFCLHGNGEVGNGSSDGTLTASSTNQLAYLFGSGPLPLIRNGSTYFGDHGVIVVQPQSDVGNGSAFNSKRVDLTMRYVLANWKVDPARIYATGLSAGGGGVTRYAYDYASGSAYSLAAIIPIANIQGVGSTYTDFSRFTRAVTWFINSSDDTIAYPINSTGRIWSGYGDGWAGGISRYLDQAALGTLPGSSAKTRCLGTHPDLAAISAGGFNTNCYIPASQISATATGRYDTATGWHWVAGQTFTAGSRLQITIRDGGGHSGWWQTYGSGATANAEFWDWLLAQRLGQIPSGYGGAAAPAPLPTSEPVASLSGWSNTAGTVEGTLRVRPVDTTSPRPPYGYLDYLPRGYNGADSTKKWPLLVYLPNVTEAGDGTDTTANGHQLKAQLTKYGPLHQVAAKGWDFPAIIIAPQVTTNWAKPANVKAVVEYAKANYQIDTNRIYMTGNLEGASGTLRFAVAYPGDLAGILTIEANTPASTDQAAAIKDLPMWAAHAFADAGCPRSQSIGWIDALTGADFGGPSDAMSTYPGYGDRSHFAVDINSGNGQPADQSGESLVVTGARVAHGSATVTFPSGTSFGSGIFGMWGGSDDRPFAHVHVGSESTVYTVSRGYAGSLSLTAAYAGSATTADVRITTPAGYDATAYRSAGGAWVWNRGVAWNQAQPDDRILTMLWTQDPVGAWNATWSDVDAWNWLFAQVRAPGAAG